MVSKRSACIKSKGKEDEWKVGKELALTNT
jgi:hypothetical protein